MMVSSHMDGTGLNYAACRYCIGYVRYDFLWVLFLCTSCGGVGDALRWSVGRIFHNPFLLSIDTWMTILSLSLIVTFFALNEAMNPSSQILKIETSDIFVRLGKMWPSYTSSIKSGKSSKYGFLYCVVCPFVHPTLMCVPMFFDEKYGASALR